MEECIGQGVGLGRGAAGPSLGKPPPNSLKLSRPYCLGFLRKAPLRRHG